MLPVLRNSLFNLTKRLTSIPSVLSSNFHQLSRPAMPELRLLTPNVLNLVPQCGFKVMGKVRKRCKDCYFVRRGERMFVICNTHRRHKQMSMVKDEKNTWILSHATMSKVRPW